MPLTVPQLELCAAVLLSQLASKVMTLLNLRISEVNRWSNLTVVLTWVQSSPHLLKTFVANRELKIQELMQAYKWNHVCSEDNPADFILVDLTLINYKMLNFGGRIFLS